MAPKFRRSRVSVMYRFLIVVCSSDLKWGKRVVETVTVAEEILFSFHKNFPKMSLYGPALLLQEKLRNDTHCGRTGIYRRDKLPLL